MIFDFDIFGKTYLLITKKLKRRAIEKYWHHIQGNVLDIGCGQKPYKYLISDQKYIGIDISLKLKPDMVAVGEGLPFKKNIFNSIVCFEVLEHVKNPQLCLENMNLVLRKKGKVLLTVPFEWPLHYEPNDFWRFTPYSLKMIFNKAGFEVLDIYRIGGIFAVIGSRFVDVFSRKLDKILPIPNPFRFVVVAIIFHPISLFFYAMSRLFDNFDKQDASGWLVFASKKRNYLSYNY